ncbi:NUDIX hydrolase [bacterium]|nr:MAG: NUDIX hydrolase [bacterium]
MKNTAKNKLFKPALDPKDLKFAIIAADAALWTVADGQLLIRLVSVNVPPYFNNKAGLPGGLILPTEVNAEQSVKRLLRDKAGVIDSKVYLEQLYTFSDINRDPRGRVVALAYTGIVPWDRLSTRERENSADSWWQNVKKLPSMAYDHKEIIATALDRLKTKAAYTTIVAQFMPKEFTLTELEQAYELILDKDIDKRNFRKKILSLGILKDTGKERRGGKFRPAKLYAFRSLNVEVIEVL